MFCSIRFGILLVRMLYVRRYVAGEALPDGDESCEDSGHNRRGLHSVLAAVLHDVRGASLLRRLHPSAGVLGSVLAGLLQLRHQPVHLRAVQQRLPLRLHANPLPLHQGRPFGTSVFSGAAPASWLRRLHNRPETLGSPHGT